MISYFPGGGGGGGSTWTPVAAVYTTNAGQNFTTSVETIVDFEDLQLDTHSAVTTGATWKFTVPAGHEGWYWVSALTTLDNDASWNGTEICYTMIAVNNGNVVIKETPLGPLLNNASTAEVGIITSGLMDLSTAGDFVDVQINQQSGGTIGLTTSSTQNRINIFKVYEV